MGCSHVLLAFLAGSRERFVGVCPECGWGLLCVYTVALDGGVGWRFYPLVPPDSSTAGTFRDESVGMYQSRSMPLEEVITEAISVPIRRTDPMK